MTVSHSFARPLPKLDDLVSLSHAVGGNNFAIQYRSKLVKNSPTMYFNN